MNRRSLFRKLGAAAAVVAVAPAMSVQAEPELTDREKAEALYEKVLANPDQYPEIMARAWELMGQESPPTLQAAMYGLLSTSNDIIYASSANPPARLSIGTANQVLVRSGVDATGPNESLRSLLTSLENMGYIEDRTDV